MPAERIIQARVRAHRLGKVVLKDGLRPDFGFHEIPPTSWESEGKSPEKNPADPVLDVTVINDSVRIAAFGERPRPSRFRQMVLNSKCWRAMTFSNVSSEFGGVDWDIGFRGGCLVVGRIFQLRAVRRAANIYEECTTKTILDVSGAGPWFGSFPFAIPGNTARLLSTGPSLCWFARQTKCPFRGALLMQSSWTRGLTR